MDEFLIILGLFAILGFIVFALIRSALVGSFFYKTGFRKTGLPKEKYAEYVKGKKAELRDTMGRICGEAATDLAEKKSGSFLSKQGKCCKEVQRNTGLQSGHGNKATYRSFQIQRSRS